MKTRTLYLVRPRTPYRILWDADPVYRIRGETIRAFRNRDAAERYAAEAPPPAEVNLIKLNVSFCATPYGETLRAYPDEDAASAADDGPLLTIPVAFFVDWVREIIGIEPPQIAPRSEGMNNREREQELRAAWIEWWDAIQDSLTPAQKRELWAALTLPAYEIVEVPWYRQ